MGRALRRARRARPESRSPSTRRSPASWATSSATRSTGWRSGCSTTRPGVAVACGAELGRLPPGLPARPRRASDALDAVVEQLGELRERLEGKGRAVPFGVEVMGRVRELGTAEDVFAIAARARLGAPGDRLRPHARDSDGAFTDVETFAGVARGRGRACSSRARRSTSTSRDIAFANRNETKHLPYGEGTLRAEPLARGARALRAAGDGDPRVAGRGVDSGDPAQCSRGG